VAGRDEDKTLSRMLKTHCDALRIHVNPSRTARQAAHQATLGEQEQDRGRQGHQGAPAISKPHWIWFSPMKSCKATVTVRTLRPVSISANRYSFQEVMNR